MPRLTRKKPQPEPPLGTLPAPALEQLQPMLLSSARHGPAKEDGWLAEVKYDGYRVMAEFQPGRAALRSRGGADCTKWFPEVAAGLAGATAGGPHIVDGEVCVLDGIGRSDFDALHTRAMRRRRAAGDPPAVFCVFDLLVLNGRNVMELPLQQRKELLRQLLTPAPASVLFVDYFEGLVRALFQKALELKLEGVVAKRADSPYRPGARSTHWVKLKRPGAVPAGRFRRGDV